MTLTIDQAVDQLCPKACLQCGADLPRPGEECPSCGELPGLLRQEAAEHLAQPGELARMQAEHHREEAQRLLGEQVAQLLEADRVLHADRLSQARDQAEAELAAGIARRDQAEAALKDPRRAETRAAGERDDAEAARRGFALDLQKAQRYKKGTRAVVLGRQALALAEEELAAKETALSAAREARQRAEGVFSGADAEVRRLTAVRDSAVARMAGPGPSRLSAESLKELAAWLLDMARELFWVRMKLPGNRFTQADVEADDRIGFAIGIAEALARFTGVSAIELAQGADAGYAQAKAELDARPGLRKGNSVDDMTVLPPGSRRIPGGVLPGSPQASARPGEGGPALALDQGNPHRGGDTVYRHPGRQPLP